VLAGIARLIVEAMKEERLAVARRNGLVKRFLKMDNSITHLFNFV
jgi:hypothetical protein